MDTLQLTLHSFTICLNEEHLGIFYMLCNLLLWGGPTKDFYLPLNWTKFDNFNDPGKGFSKRNCIINFLWSKKQFLTFSNALTVWVSKAEIYSFQKSKSPFRHIKPWSFYRELCLWSSWRIKKGEYRHSESMPFKIQ